MQHELSLFYIIIIIVLSLENKYTIQYNTLIEHSIQLVLHSETMRCKLRDDKRGTNETPASGRSSWWSTTRFCWTSPLQTPSPWSSSTPAPWGYRWRAPCRPRTGTSTTSRLRSTNIYNASATWRLSAADAHRGRRCEFQRTSFSAIQFIIILYLKWLAQRHDTNTYCLLATKCKPILLFSMIGVTETAHNFFQIPTQSWHLA